MKHSRISLLCLLASFVSCAGAMTADSPHNPYQAIIDRNVFGLKTPPPPPKPPNPEDNKPPTKIRLTGIMTGFPPGNKRALMMETVPPKPGSPANEVSLMLTEGQSEGDVEVIEIDEKEGKVKISQNGNTTTLDLPKPPNSPAAAAPATAGGPTPAGFAPPPAPAAAPANPFNAGGMKTIPTRPIRPVGSGNGASTGYGAPGVTTAGTGLNFGMPNAPQQQPNQTQPADSPEVSALLIEANREQMKASGDQNYRFLPPTPLNPKANTAEDPELQAAGGGNPGVPTLPPPVRRR